MAQISIVKYKSLIEGKRIDSEFYSPEQIQNEKLIRSFETIQFGNKELFIVSDGPFGSDVHSDEYVEEGIPFLRTEEINEIGIDETKVVSITKLKHEKIIRSEVKFEDLVLTKTGVYYGVATVIPKTIKGSKVANIRADLAKIRIKNKEVIDPYYLSFFLNSKLGYMQTRRYSSGMSRPRITVDSIKKMYVPLINNQGEFKDFFIEINNKKEKSVFEFKEAEKILLNELSLKNYKPEQKLSFDAKLSEVLNSKRIDADYYQPKYKEIETKIKKYSLGSKPLSKVIKVKNTNFFPEDETEYSYIELSNISSNGNITGCTKDLGKNLPTRARRKVSKGDVIISTIEGSLESCALITEDYAGALCSTGFFVLNSKIINSETLLVLVKSLIMQNLLKKGCKGTILTAISKDELNKIEVPLIRDSVQKEISQKIKESYKLRKESKELLEKAKKMVEDEIEKGAKK